MMTILKGNAHSDFEVVLNATPNGLRYDMENRETGEVKRGLESIETYRVLSAAYTSGKYKLPSKFVIEFAQHVIADLTQQLGTK
jgi:hypothetical protein